MKIYKFILPVFIIFSQLMLAQENFNALMYEGNKEFNNKNYESSSSKFLEATKAKEKDFASHYNLGNSFYKRKMYEEARAEYEKADKFAKNSADKMAAEYNLGNTYMETQQPEKAAEYYKKALKQDPYNESVKRNYQIAKLKEKEKQERQKNQKKNNQENKPGEKGKNLENDQKSKEGKGENPSPQQGRNDQNMKGNGENSNGADEKNNEGEIPKDLENAILNRVENQERETAKRILNKKANSMPQSNAKDW